MHLLHRQAQCRANRVVYQPCPGGVFQHLAQPVAAAPGGDLHEIGVSVRPEPDFDVIERSSHMQQAQQPLQLRAELLLLGRRNRGRPGIAHRRVGVVGFAVKILVVKGDELQFPVHREAVGIRGISLLLDEVFQDEPSAAGELQRIPDRRLQLRRAVHPADAFAASVVHRLDDQGIGKLLRHSQGVFEAGKAPGIGHPEAVLPQKGAEASLVLQDRHRLVRADIRQAHPVRHIGRRDDTRVTGEGHYAVHLQLLRQFQGRFPVDDAHVVVLVRHLMREVVREIVAGDRVTAQRLRLPDHRDQIARAAEQQQFFHRFSPALLFCRMLFAMLRI